MNLHDSIQKELDMAVNARRIGNEGRARVCARRAAGIAAGEYFHRHEMPNPGPSAYDRLKILATTPEIEPRYQAIAQHLILRVDEAFKLPDDIDLIAEARQFIDYLIGPR